MSFIFLDQIVTSFEEVLYPNLRMKSKGRFLLVPMAAGFTSFKPKDSYFSHGRLPTYRYCSYGALHVRTAWPWQSTKWSNYIRKTPNFISCFVADAMIWGWKIYTDGIFFIRPSPGTGNKTDKLSDIQAMKTFAPTTAVCEDTLLFTTDLASVILVIA